MNRNVPAKVRNETARHGPGELAREGARSARAAAEEMAAGGAIMTVAGVPAVRQLVGHLDWLDENRVFWFPAFGDKPQDGAVLAFSQATVVPTGICFLEREVIAGFLAPVATAAVEDPEDYAVAWRLWQQIKPLRQGLIAEALEIHAPARSV